MAGKHYGIQLEPFWQDKEKVAKDAQDRALFEHLVSEGYPEDRATYIVNKVRNTGQLDTTMPRYQNAAMQGNDSQVAPPADEVGLNNRLPMAYDQRGEVPNRPVPLSPVSDIPQRSTIQDFLPMRQDVMTGIDIKNPANTVTVPMKPGTKNVGTFQFDKPSKPTKVLTFQERKDLADIKAYSSEGDYHTPESEARMSIIEKRNNIIHDDIPTQEQATADPTLWEKLTDMFSGTNKNNGTQKPTNSDLKSKASQWLASHNAPVTDANIDAVIKQKKVQ